jgi:histidine kinase
MAPLYKKAQNICQSLISRLILLAGLVLFVVISTWAYFNINYYKNEMVEGIIQEVDRLGSTIKLGTHYAMMLNSREDINNIINNIARQKGIEHIRIFNKHGDIKFSNLPEEVDRRTTIKDDACFICHNTEPPLQEVELKSRTRIFESSEDYRLIGVISPIYNEPNCSSDTCHVHPQGKLVLGALDVVVSLKDTDAGMLAYERRIIGLAVVSFLATSAIIAMFLFIFVNRPIKKLIGRTQEIGQGKYDCERGSRWSGEIGQLALAIDRMGLQIREKQEALNKQRHEYQELFEQVPCYITVQDRNLRLIRFNRQFTDQFGPTPGDFCYQVYKGRTARCDPCPVLMTFEDGMSHSSEETGITKDGSITQWIGRTSALRDSQGHISAVMEMSLDITQMKRLEEEIRKSEEKYRSIFNNIPNPIFVLDKKNLVVLDCNDSVRLVYGLGKDEIIGASFLNLFEEGEQQHYALEVRTADILNQAKQMTGDGRSIYVNIRVSPWEYLGRAALLVSTSDITKKLLAEQQLIQASKMATLGEMATGIAHELNQPLSVMKTASSFIVKKINKGEAIREDILRTMADEIDKHVDRASRIINHLREFGRKSEVKKERVDINAAVENALDIFSQQLKLRGIEVVKELEGNLPAIFGNSNRLEQVFVNLLINARDAIEERCERAGKSTFPKEIRLRTGMQQGRVTIEVGDTGVGIPKSLLEKIFEPFFTTKKVGRGTGLGLSISYGIIQDYDGTIRVETKENEGSNFIVQFPVQG